MRALAIALLALAVLWPRRLAWQLIVAAASGVCLVASTWHASFEGRANEWAAVVAVVAGVALWRAAPRAHAVLAGMGGAWWVLLGSAAAVYGCVPETDQMREVAVAVAAGGVAELLLRRRLPSAALVAAAALVEWSALYGATGQARALVGGLFALVPLVAVAVVAARRLAGADPRWLPWGVSFAWVAVVIGVARTGGVAGTLPPAVRAAGLGAAGGAAVTAALLRLARR